MEFIGFQGRLRGAGVRTGRHCSGWYPCLLSHSANAYAFGTKGWISGWFAHEEGAEQGYLEPPTLHCLIQMPYPQDFESANNISTTLKKKKERKKTVSKGISVQYLKIISVLSCFLKDRNFILKKERIGESIREQEGLTFHSLSRAVSKTSRRIHWDAGENITFKQN